jgi:iron complex outermembrane recepter protein
MKFILLIFLLLTIPTNGQDSVYTLSPVEVTGVRAVINNFQSYIRIEKDDMVKGETGLSLEESLIQIPGVLIDNRHNPSMGDKISIRGIGSRASFGVRGIKILVDNIPLTMADGQTQTNNIDLYSAGSTEIIKGPASSFYGNASGGVINYVTEVPSSHLININPGLIFGENNLQKYSLKLSGTVKDHSYLLSISNTQYNGFREHSAQKTYRVNSLYRNKINQNFNLTAIINYFNAPYLQNPSSLDKEASVNNRTSAREFIKLQGAGEKAEQLQGGVTLDYNGDDLSFETTIYYVKRSLLNPIPGRIIDLQRNAGGLRSAFKKSFNNDKIDFSISGGIDIEYQSDQRDEFVNNGLPNTTYKPPDIFDNLNYGSRLLDQREAITGGGPFIAGEILLNNRIGFIGVVRYDYFNYTVTDYFSSGSGSRIMKQVSPAAGFLYKPNIFSRLFINYSTSFQTPTAAELSNRPDGLGGFNPFLDPEKINQFEIGGEYLLKYLSTRISAAVYLMNFTDLLIPYQSGVSEEIFYRNAGKAINRGIEFAAELEIIENLKTSFSINIMDFRFTDYIIEQNNSLYQLDDKLIPGIPGKVFGFRALYNPSAGFWGKISLLWNEEFYTNDFNGPPPGSASENTNFVNESYLQADLRAGYVFLINFIDLNIFIGINNLLDLKYNGSVVPNAAGERYFEPSPGRTLYFGTSINF